MIQQSQSSKVLRAIFIFSCITIGFSQNWNLEYSQFQGWAIGSSDGWERNDGAAPQIVTCPYNSMSVICLDVNYQINQKTVSSLPPHFELKFIVDVYFIDSWDGEYGYVYFGGNQIYAQQGLYYALTPYENQCGGWWGGNQLTLKTIVSTISHTTSSVQLKIQTSLDQPYTDESFCFRNVQLWARLCHPTCSSCNGDANTNCLTCYTGSPSSGKCTCTNSNAKFFYESNGCVSECNRASYLADMSLYCQFDERVTLYSTSFDWPQYATPTPIDWQLYTNGLLVSQKTFTCNGWGNVGKYYTSDIITKSLSFGVTVRKIRIRIGFYLFTTWNQYSSVIVYMDGQLINMIYQFSGQFNTVKSIVIQTSGGTCSNLAADQTFKHVRTEQIVKLTSQTPTLKIKATQDQWILRHIYIDQIVCALNCSTCLDDDNCSACNGGYFLYKGQCVTSCPIHSTVSSSNCIDFDQETQYTSYLLKAFYLESSPDTEATNLFTLISQSGTNFSKGVFWSYLRNKRIFGGALTWFYAQFSKTYSVTVPHYAIRVRMVVILGDNFGSGAFRYRVNSGAYQIITRGSAWLSHSQQWGDTYEEYFYQVNYYATHTSGTLPIVVECLGDSGLSLVNSFCGIQDYFITILEVISNYIQCPPLCTACTSLTSCSAWISSPFIDTVTHTCVTGYYVDYATRSCLPSPVCGNEIIEADEECDDGNQIENDNCFNCKFSCQSYYPNCLIMNFKTCDYGYYLNLFDNLCYPLCGDKLIVKEEDCDDGNLIPFDGCHQCQSSCQESCLECRTGQCYRCQSGWILNQKTRICDPICGDNSREVMEVCDESMSFSLANFCYSCSFQCPKYCVSCSYGFCSQCEKGFTLNKVKNDCQPICGDKLIVPDEECDDGNLIPQDGCHECQYQCQDSCLECQFGKCYRCEAGWEWKPQTFRCEPICGDGLRVELEVCDDRIYQLGDVCLACQFQCPDYCSSCDYGVCKLCEQGYQLDKTRNDCQPICGDKLVVANEECDDGNLIPQDGCHECQYQCQDSCLECRQGKCYRCESGWAWKSSILRCEPICGDGFRVEIEVCDDKIYQFGDVCLACQFQCPDYCTQCNYGVCQSCEQGYQLDKTRNDCQPICGDKLIVVNEECDDGNLIPQDGCHECQYQCQDSCLECQFGKCYRCEAGWEWKPQTFRCEPICGDGLRVELEVCDDRIYQLGDVCQACQFQCPDYCSSCDYGVCKLCEQGYQLDKTRNDCQPICGDKLIVANEECDDGNLIPQDGCHECQYQCQDSCLECQFGKCYRCESGWEWKPQTFRCEPMCGDGLRVEVEVCDDKIYQLGDVCQTCEFQCPDHCTLCDYGVCKSCDLGYQLDNKRNDCQPICGDKLIVSNEECDDGNLIPQDGCHECSYQCQVSCLECRQGKCYRCESGWEWKPQTFRCEPICGDGLRVQVEVCDDFNYLLGDICLACQFQCPYNCNQCDYGVCKVCEPGFQLEETRNFCQSICGDSLIVQNEECDDGNLIPQDGCHECQYQCQDSCLECQQGKCYRCEAGWEWKPQTFRCEPICGDGLRVELEVCDDRIYQLGDVCQACQFQCPDYCTLCNYGVCKLCEQGYQLDKTRNDCQPICGDKLIVANEECDDGNLIPQDGCHECQYQCQDSCLECQQGKCYRCEAGWEWKPQTFRCEPICGDGLRVELEVCDDRIYQLGDVCLACQFQCPDYCSSCDYGVCKLCEQGYQLDKTRNDCQPICGDKLIVANEECDDGNLIPQDGCHECQYQCQDSCLECQQGKCYRCEAGWEWKPQTFRCEPICGDGLRVELEVCDDRIYQLGDVCLACQFQCPDYCSSCDYGVCKLCEQGYQLDKTRNDCQPICGDKLIVANEECDDGNLIPQDGCHKCKYQCQNSCLECRQGKCYSCESGWELNYRTFRCEPICGDGYRAEIEECDDGLYTLFDVCFQCNFLCPTGCQICKYGSCIECSQGFILDGATNQCVSICGDGLITQFEECDDGNQLAFDGCFNCKIECQDDCIECRLGKCYRCKTGFILNQQTHRCTEICGDHLLIGKEVCDDNNQQPFDGCYICGFSCSPNCLICNYGVCIQCETGYYLHQETIRCYPIYGDKMTTNLEQCDDGNLIPFDGCLNAEYSCQDSCLECRKGFCYKCKVGWLLNKSLGRCLTVCGDGIQAGQEVCDDANNIKYDTCYLCNYYCPPECATCDKGFCLTCIDGFGLSLIDQRCYPIRGDGIVTQWEECDDNNVDPFDQCLSYQYSCQDHCDECVRGKCLSCKKGWYWNNVDLTCDSYCGDAIQAGQELCDDGNDSPFDRCFQCKYYCEPNCETCNLGLCVKCYFGYALHIEDNQCYPIFGDKFITKLEQCEDEDLNPFDGCRVGKYECQEACTDCRNGQCWHCTTGWKWDRVDFSCQPICGDKLRVGDELCDDGNFNILDGCVLCRFQCPPDCQQCNFQGRCLQCKTGFGLNLQDNICYSICGDGLITQHEECDNGLLLPYDDCQSCKYKCSEACLNCFEGRCYGCNPGWNFIRGECVSICGDLVAVSQEVCDDGNSQEFDGCYDCKFSCDRNCSDCRYGQCFNCTLGWYLTDERKCESHCGDGLFVDSEWCDDGNETPFDGCYKCNYLCSEGCIRCLHGECLECEPPLMVVKKNQSCQIKSICDPLIGWYYDEYDNQCKTKCGDKLTQGLEECDDGNFVRYDGCFECKYQCDEMCLVCVKGKCTVCQSGYHIYNGFCQTQCGDGVVLAQYEQCDDANDDPRDGCTFCKIDPNYSCITPFQGTSVCFKNIPNCVEYSDVSVCSQCKPSFFLINNECISCALTCEGCEGTPNNCNKCLFESCTICESKIGLYTNVTSKQCYSKCGDQIRALQEECDDGNLIDGDGCSSLCAVEYKYECGNAECVKKDLGDANGNWINSTTRNVVSLFIENDTQTVFCRNLTVWIEQFSLQEFSYEITDEIKCELEFHYFKTIELFNLIHIKVPLEWKQRVLTTETKEIILKPRKWTFYSTTQLEAVSSVTRLTENLIFAIQICLLVAFASNSTAILWGMLEILFWIHYIYLLNVQNPIQVQNFLLLFDIHKLLMIPDFIKLNQKSDSYYTEPPPKFIEKNINPLFIQNCQVFTVFMVISIGLYILAFLVNSLINMMYNKPIQQKRKLYVITFNQAQSIPEEQQVPPLPLLIKFIENLTSKYQNQIKSTWLQIISVMFLDLSVGSILQLNNLSQKDNIIVKINMYVAIANILFLCFILYLANSVLNKNQILLKNSTYFSNFGSLYAGLNRNNNTTKTYYFINLFRKVFFMVSVVLLYEKPFIQTIVCCLATSLNSLLTLFGNPFNSFKLLILNVVPNLCITWFSFISVALISNETVNLIDEYQVYLIGWIQIGLIVMAIGIQIFLLLQEVMVKIKDILRPAIAKIFSE